MYDTYMSMIFLVKRGIPYDAVMNMEERETNLLLGMLLALDEREAQGR